MRYWNHKKCFVGKKYFVRLIPKLANFWPILAKFTKWPPGRKCSPPLFHALPATMSGPIRPSKMAVNSKRHDAVGKRNVHCRSAGKHVQHDAGFIASLLEEYNAVVHITATDGKILLPKQRSQGAFIEDWRRKTGEETLSTRHIGVWIAKVWFTMGMPLKTCFFKGL